MECSRSVGVPGAQNKTNLQLTRFSFSCACLHRDSCKYLDLSVCTLQYSQYNQNQKCKKNYPNHHLPCISFSFLAFAISLCYSTLLCISRFFSKRMMDGLVLWSFSKRTVVWSKGSVEIWGSKQWADAGSVTRSSTYSLTPLASLSFVLFRGGQWLCILFLLCTISLFPFSSYCYYSHFLCLLWIYMRLS